MANRKAENERRFDANAGKMVETKRDDNEAVQQRANRRRNRGASSPADWGTANASKLLAAIVAVSRHGFAIRFGYTRDGGAFAVGIIGDGEPYTEFTRPTEDIDLYLDGIIDDYGK